MHLLGEDSIPSRPDTRCFPMQVHLHKRAANVEAPFLPPHSSGELMAYHQDDEHMRFHVSSKQITVQRISHSLSRDCRKCNSENGCLCLFAGGSRRLRKVSKTWQAGGSM